MFLSYPCFSFRFIDIILYSDNFLISSISDIPSPFISCHTRSSSNILSFSSITPSLFSSYEARASIDDLAYAPSFFMNVSPNISLPLFISPSLFKSSDKIPSFLSIQVVFSLNPFSSRSKYTPSLIFFISNPSSSISITSGSYDCFAFSLPFLTIFNGGSSSYESSYSKKFIIFSFSETFFVIENIKLLSAVPKAEDSPLTIFSASMLTTGGAFTILETTDAPLEATSDPDFT